MQKRSDRDRKKRRYSSGFCVFLKSKSCSFVFAWH